MLHWWRRCLPTTARGSKGRANGGIGLKHDRQIWVEPNGTPAQPAGQTVSHYLILGKIGGGGIGVPTSVVAHSRLRM
jgi:hypothetical protein